MLNIDRLGLALLFFAGWFVCSGEPVPLPPDEWLPVSGSWSVEEDQIRELSDSSDSGHRPFWAIAGRSSWRDYRFESELQAFDGVGSFYLAARWQNRDNHYALEVGGPGGRLTIFLVREGQATPLATAENAVTIGARRPPVAVALEATGATLRALVAGELVVEAVDHTFATGGVGIGGKHRRAAFQQLKVAWTKSTREATAPKVEYTGVRRVFLREERGGECVLSVTNTTGVSLAGLGARLSMDGLAPREVVLGHLEPGETATIRYPVDTLGLCESKYGLSCDLLVGEQALASKSFPVWIAPKINRYGLEVLCWDGLGVSEEALAETQRLGFTSRTVLLFRGAAAQDVALPRWVVPAVDAGLRFGLDAMIRVSTERICEEDQTFILGPDAKPQLGKHKMNCPNHSLVRQRVAAAAIRLADTVENLPAFRYALMNSETENEERKLAQCRHDFCLAKVEAELGFGVPDGFERGWSVVGAQLWKAPETFGVSENGLVADDNVHYRFLKWWWQRGSGFPGLNRLFSRTLKERVPRLKTFHDPVLRCPAFAGRCSGLDFASQWTYTVPSPLGILQNADELLAAADRGQPVCQTIQLFWYKSAVMPKPGPNEEGAARNEAVFAQDADAWGNYITLSPAHLREAVWLALSRPVSMLQFGGASAICDNPGSYDYTNPDTPEELARLASELIKPYGPMLREMQEQPTDTAILSSAANSLFARGGSYGQTAGTFGDCHKTIVLAQFRPRVLFDETVQTRGLDGYRVLFLPGCKVMLSGVHERLLAFAQAGGVVVVDNAGGPEVPGAMPFDFPETKGKGLGPEQEQALWVAAGTALKEALHTRGVRWSVSSSSPDVVFGVRRGRGAACIFVVNDRRCAGDYVGRHGRILDDGVAQEIDLFFDASDFDGGVFYDVLLRRRLDTIRQGGRLAARVSLPPAGGRLVYWSPRPIAAVLVRAPGRAKRGSRATLHFGVCAPDGDAVPGVQPLSVTVRDSAGRLNAYSGYYRAIDGVFELDLPLAFNDRVGCWRARVEELVAGNRAEAMFLVE